MFVINIHILYRLSLGEKGSLAIPDSELDVYEVHPVKVGQYSVSVPEIQLDLSDISTLDSQIGNLIMSIINIFLLKLKSVYWFKF